MHMPPVVARFISMVSPPPRTAAPVADDCCLTDGVYQGDGRLVMKVAAYIRPIGVDSNSSAVFFCSSLNAEYSAVSVAAIILADSSRADRNLTSRWARSGAD